MESMSKGERRRLRALAVKEGRPLTGELALDRGADSVEYTETPKGRDARERWARKYDDLNGAPEGMDDR